MDEISRDVRSKKRFFFFLKKGGSLAARGSQQSSAQVAPQQRARSPLVYPVTPSWTGDSGGARTLPASSRPAPVTSAPAQQHLPSAASDDDTWRPRRSHVLLAGDLRSPDAAVRVLAER